MTLDEAIKHAEGVAEEKNMQAGFDTDYLCYQMSDTERNQCRKCAEEHRQLAEWLKDYKRLLEQTRWIPVNERLPEEYGEYLITWATSQSKRPFIGISEGEVTSEYDHEHNRFKFKWLLEDYVKNYPDVEVIAWMPLPQPYKADKDYKAEVITRGNCMMCGKELTEGLFFCKECKNKAESEE